jgi:hypothetical protein
MAETQYGSFDDLLGITPESLRPIVLKLKELILDVDPHTVEVVRLGDRAATYGIGPRKMKEGYAYILPHKSWVNLGFYQGAGLSDPKGLMEGTGKKLRHIKIRTIEDADKSGIRVEYGNLFPWL